MVARKAANGSARNGSPRIDPNYACFGMRLARSKIHRWGVYATEFIPAGRKVIEYTGERISRRETKRRADASEFTYLFTLDAYWTIDGAVGRLGRGVHQSLLRSEPDLADPERPHPYI